MAVDLDWNDLRYFLHAARAKTLAGASRVLGVEHTTVGRRLAALEEALGAPLVFRRAGGLELTPLGERTLPLATEIERAVRSVCDFAEEKRARVRIATPSGMTRLFVRVVDRMRQEFPDFALEISTGARYVDLDRGEADLAVRLGPVTDERLIVRKLADMGWTLYAAPSYLAGKPPLKSPDDFTGHDLIAYDLATAQMPAAQWMEERVRTGRVVIRNRDLLEMAAATVSGGGIALLPCLIAEEEPGLVRLTEDVMSTRQLSVVYRREARATEEVRAVIRLIVEVIGEQMDIVTGVRKAKRETRPTGGPRSRRAPRR